jgi:CHAT domain-containing protein
MTLSLRNFLVIIVAASLHGHAFSQGKDSAVSLYAAGQSLASSNPDKAFPLLQSAMSISQQKKDWELYLKSINALASLKMGRQEEKKELVFSWLKEAITLSKDFKSSDQLAQLNYNIGKRYDLAYEIELPIQYYEKAKRIWIGLKGEENSDVAACYHGLGDVYKYNKFDFYEAEKSYEKALQIREKIQFKDIKTLYQNYYSLSATNRSQKDFDKALSYGTNTLELAQQLSPIDVEKSSGMVANIYRDMGQTAEAKEFYFKALALNNQTRDRSNRAWYYLCLGDMYKTDSLFYQALPYFKKAYLLYQSPDVKDQDLFINVLINLIESYSLVGDNKRFYSTFSELARELSLLNREHSREAVQSWFILAGHHARRLSYDSALHYYQKALITSCNGFQSLSVADNPTEEQIGYRYYVSEILAMKAAALRAKFHSSRNKVFLNHSLVSLRLAEILVSKQRSTLDMEASKWEFLEDNYDLYENILSCIFDGVQSNTSDTLLSIAFQYFERSKSRSLADALAEKEHSAQISNNDSLFQAHAELKRQLFTVQDAINNELNSSRDPAKLKSLHTKIVALDQNIQSYKFAIEQKFPGYFNVKYGGETIPLNSLQGILRNKGQVLLEYFWGNETVYGLGVNGAEVVFKRIGSADSIKAIVEKLRLHLDDEGANIGTEAFENFTGHSFQLYQLLVSPFQAIVRSSSRLLVIPDGPISQIPFEVLIEEIPSSMQVNYRSLKYLIQSFTIGYSYSSNMFLHKNNNQRDDPPSMLAIGFTGAEPFRNADSKLEVIAGVEEELKSLEKHFNSGKFLTGNEATETNFKILAPEFDILHLAIHGVGDMNRKFSAKLSFRKYNNEDDGELHAYELYGLKLKALMAVLSACESGVGKDYKGEGMISMASAFIYSGCENILMSLWKVNDQISTTVMDNFYLHLLSGSSIDEALRKAKTNYIETADELTADPKVWAPFIAYGSLDPVFQKDDSKVLVYIAVAFLLILLLSVSYFRKRVR